MALNDLFTVIFPNSEIKRLERECERLENELKETLDKLYWSNKALGTYKERYNKLRKKNIELRTKLYKSKKKLG